MNRKQRRSKVENNRAYLKGTKFENDGIKKTRKYADGRQKTHSAVLHK